MRMNKAFQNKCWHVYKRHDDTKMLVLSKYTSAFTSALLSANMGFHGCWSEFLLLFSKILLGNENPKKSEICHNGVYKLDSLF